VTLPSGQLVSRVGDGDVPGTEEDDCKGHVPLLAVESEKRKFLSPRSLEEGFEETLTLHRLGLFRELGISLKTTNSIESLHSLMASRTDKVDYWKNSNQRQRWVATALLDIEPGLRRIRGYRHLPALRHALQMELNLISNYEEKLA
jgi:transposase-like protein